MKLASFIILLLAPIFLIAQHSEPVGSAEYFYKNATDSTLHLECVLQPQLGNRILSFDILSGETKSLFQDSMFGVNPTPSDTFKSIKITLQSGVEYFLEDQALNKQWTAESPDKKNGDVYYHTNYYLSLE